MAGRVETGVVEKASQSIEFDLESLLFFGMIMLAVATAIGASFFGRQTSSAAEPSRMSDGRPPNCS